jgi:hypothetical protein
MTFIILIGMFFTLVMFYQFFLFPMIIQIKSIYLNLILRGLFYGIILIGCDLTLIMYLKLKESKYIEKELIILNSIIIVTFLLMNLYIILNQAFQTLT